MKRLIAATIAALLFALPAAAEVSLRDTAALQAFLASGTPCCVIDARNEVGKALERSSKAKEIYAVKGGERTWRAVTGSTAASGMPRGFIIPKNTCESGTAIQQY